MHLDAELWSRDRALNRRLRGAAGTPRWRTPRFRRPPRPRWKRVVRPGCRAPLRAGGGPRRTFRRVATVPEVRADGHGCLLLGAGYGSRRTVDEACGVIVGPRSARLPVGGLRTTDGTGSVAIGKALRRGSGRVRPADRHLAGPPTDTPRGTPFPRSAADPARPSPASSPGPYGAPARRAGAWVTFRPRRCASKPSRMLPGGVVLRDAPSFTACGR